MTEEEQNLLRFYRSEEGERVWRMSDLAYEEYQTLLSKEANEKVNHS